MKVNISSITNMSTNITSQRIRRGRAVRFGAQISRYRVRHISLLQPWPVLTKDAQELHRRHEDSLQHSPGGADRLHPETGPAARVGGLEHQGNLD